MKRLQPYTILVGVRTKFFASKNCSIPASAPDAKYPNPKFQRGVSVWIAKQRVPFVETAMRFETPVNRRWSVNERNLPWQTDEIGGEEGGWETTFAVVAHSKIQSLTITL